MILNLPRPESVAPTPHFEGARDGESQQAGCFVCRLLGGGGGDEGGAREGLGLGLEELRGAILYLSNAEHTITPSNSGVCFH
jgi:hypothetical protein